MSIFKEINHLAISIANVKERLMSMFLHTCLERCKELLLAKLGGITRVRFKLTVELNGRRGITLRYEIALDRSNRLGIATLRGITVSLVRLD